MTFSDDLRRLALGFHPETGEALDPDSVAQKPETIRLLFILSEELAEKAERKGTEGRRKLSPEERIEKNLAEGRPARSNLPWEEEERGALLKGHAGGETPPQLAARFQRSVLAIVAQLEKAGVMDAGEAAVWR